MQQPLFSILIAQYNNGRFFKDCYDSIIKQTYQNFEVIIVDDGSTDDSIKIMKSIIGDVCYPPKNRPEVKLEK